MEEEESQDGTAKPTMRFTRVVIFMEERNVQLSIAFFELDWIWKGKK